MVSLSYAIKIDLTPLSLLAGLFKDVVILDAMPPAHSNLKVDGIFVPAISHVYALGRAEITYKLALHSSAGAALGAWDAEGSGGSGAVFVSDLLRLAMRDAAANFVKGFRREPVVKNWLKQAGIESMETDPRAPLRQIDEGVKP